MSQKGSAPRPSTDATVFIIDDDPSVCRSIRYLIESVGLRAETYSSAQAFLERFSLGRSGCIVLDVRMPGMSGIELQRLLAERGTEIPIVFVTGHGDVQLAVRAMKFGAVDFLEKPFHDQVLLDCVSAAIQRDAQTRATRAEQSELRERLADLTEREQDVLRLIARGNGNKQIAATLRISEKTVESHRTRLARKLRSTSLADLVRLAIQATQSGVLV